MVQRQFEVFVRNAEDEYITTIELHSEIGDGAEYSGGRRRTKEAATNALPSRCIVVDYTRDPGVLGTKARSGEALTMVSVKNHDKLKSFRAYLAGRKKAGIVKLPGGGSFFLLPSDDSDVVTGESILGLIHGGSDGGVRDGTHPPIQVPHTDGAQALPSIAPSSGSGSGGVADTGSTGGFLGSLMGTLSQTHKSVAGTAAVDRVNRAQEQAIKQRVESFKLQVREKLEAFSTDPTAISHTFPHVEKSLRSIQHGLAEDFDGVTSRTEGEVDDRRVVVYKLGYEPPEEEVQLDPQVMIGMGRSAGSASTASAAPMPPMGVGGAGKEDGEDGGPNDLMRIGTVVKDRRTVQDIEEESRKRRRL